jgi:hypothetical protein
MPVATAEARVSPCRGYGACRCAGFQIYRARAPRSSILLNSTRRDRSFLEYFAFNSSVRSSSSTNAFGAFGRFATHYCATSAMVRIALRTMQIGGHLFTPAGSRQELERRSGFRPAPPLQSLPRGTLRLPGQARMFRRLRLVISSDFLHGPDAGCRKRASFGFKVRCC